MSVKLRVRGQTKPPDCRGGAMARRMGQNGKWVGGGEERRFAPCEGKMPSGRVPVLSGRSPRSEGVPPSIEFSVAWDEGGMPQAAVAL